MPLYMLDTDTCIYVLNERDPRLLQRFNRLAAQISISTVTLGELLFGAEKSNRRTENLTIVSAFAERLDVLPFTPIAAKHFAEIRADTERAGAPCGAYDLLIGAHARSEGLTVVTNNVREFGRMPGVRTESWR